MFQSPRNDEHVPQDHTLRQISEEAGLIEGNKVFLNATLLKSGASFDSLEEHKEACELKYSPEEYLDRVWTKNQEQQEENKQHTQNGPDEGHSNSNSAGSQGTTVEPNKKTDKESKDKRLKTKKRLVSRTDPDAALITHNNTGGVLLAHKVHVAIDGGPAHIVTGVEVTPGNVAEAHAAPTLIGKHTWNTGCLPKEAVADKGYGRKHFYFASFSRRGSYSNHFPQNLGGRNAKRSLRLASSRRERGRLHLSSGQENVPYGSLRKRFCTLPGAQICL